jgi:hypothetical protein
MSPAAAGLPCSSLLPKKQIGLQRAAIAQKQKKTDLSLHSAPTLSM